MLKNWLVIKIGFAHLPYNRFLRQIALTFHNILRALPWSFPHTESASKRSLFYESSIWRFLTFFFPNEASRADIMILTIDFDIQNNNFSKYGAIKF